jgi:hypothetical protein
MVVTFRMMIVAIAAFGAALGIAFGVGVAYGKGDKETVQPGLSQQQLQQLLGIGTGGVGGTSAFGGFGGASASGTPGAGGAAAGGLGALLGNSTVGAITAIDGETITVQGLTGPVKVKVGAIAKINTYKPGNFSDLKVGDSVFVAGSRQQDGSVDATSVNQLPAGLVPSGGGASGGGFGGARPTPTATPGR